MLRMVLRAILTAGLGITLLAGSAAAENRSGSFNISPLVGGYLFEGNQNLKDRPVFGIGLGYNFDQNWGLEGTFTYTPSRLEGGGSHDQINVYTGRLDALYHFLPGAKVVPYAALGGGIISLGSDSTPDESHDDQDLIVDYGVGLKFFFHPDLALRLDVRHVLDFNVNDDHKSQELYNNLAALAGVTWQLGGHGQTSDAADADLDGVVDAVDRCPGTVAGTVVDQFGCPTDSDGDGILDAADLCPGTPDGVTVDASGCPADSDRDGVIDDRDRCPNTPAASKVDAAGCPQPEVIVVPSGDSDGDGITDDNDKCPNTPAGMPVNGYGCLRDSDRDGVFDIDDRCPDSPPRTPVGSDGCPVPQGQSLTLQIEFASGSAQVNPKSIAELDQARAFIAAHPGAKIRVEGHTDSVGSAPYNLKLSQRRAETVRTYLLRDSRLKPALITARGYGESHPIKGNNTPEGRFANRRVVITLSD